MAKSLNPRSGQQGRANPQAHKTFTMSAISTSELTREFIPSLNSLGRALSAWIAEDPFRKMDVMDLQARSVKFMGGARDIGSFILGLEKITSQRFARGNRTMKALELSAAAERARLALDKTIVKYSYGKDYIQSNSLHVFGFRAFAMWLPSNLFEYQTRIHDFEISSLYQLAPEWKNAIDALLNPTPATPR
jgi:hypothetical protein